MFQLTLTQILGGQFAQWATRTLCTHGVRATWGSGWQEHMGTGALPSGAPHIVPHPASLERVNRQVTCQL